MSPALLGLITAFAWGSTDFLARFSGRALGALLCLFAVMAIGEVALSLLLATRDGGLPWRALASPWLLAAGLANAAAMLMFYEAIRRGPLTLVAPINDAYPVWVLLLALPGDAPLPGPLAWIAIGVTALGIALVIVFCPQAEDRTITPGRGRTVALSLGSSLIFAVTVVLVQRTVEQTGALTALWATRLVALLVLAGLLAARRAPFLPPRRWTGMLVAQGLLDALGYATLYAGGAGLEGAIATLCSAAYGVVTVLLARMVLREPMSGAQWVGVALVFGGVAVLGA